MTAFYPNGSPVLVPSTSPNSVGVGIDALEAVTTGASNVGVGVLAGSTLTTGANNLILGPNVASTTLATGSNNIIIGTSSAADAATAATSNSFWLGGGSTAIMSATGINGTPAVTVPGTLAATAGFSGLGASIGGTVSAVCTSQLSATSNTTLAAVTGMSVSLVAGAVYCIDIYLSVSAGASGGLKVSLAQGSATATSFIVDQWTYSTTTVANQSNSASYSGNQIAYTGAATAATISGTITVNAAGTFTVQAAQNASNGTATTVNVGSYMMLTRVS